jgi:heme A synthase
VSILLGISALLSLAWAIGLLFFKSLVLGAASADPMVAYLANAGGVANLVFAFVFWRGAMAPPRERVAVYAALLILGLRGASGTYAVLFLLDGRAAVASLVEMITSIGLFVGVLNALPTTLADSAPAASQGGRPPT